MTDTGAALVLGRVRRAVRTATAGSILSAVVGQIVGVASGVAAARVLGVEGRGYLALLVLFPTIFALVGALGLPLAATFAVAREPRRARAVVHALFLPAVGQALALALVLAGLLAVVFADAPADVHVGAALAVASVPALLVHQYAAAILQGQQRFRVFNLLRPLPLVLYTVCLFAIWVVGAERVAIVFGVWVLSYCASAAVLAAVVARGLPARADESAAPPRREMLRFGVRGLIASASPVEVFRVDQLIVGLVLSPFALGLYVIALAFTTLPRIVAYSIGLVSFPRAAAAGGHAVAYREVWRYFWICGAISIVFVGVFEAAAPWVIDFLFGADFAGATTTARILLVGSLFMGLRRVLTDGAQGVGRPGLGTVAEVFSWAVLVPGLVVLMPRWGIEGVATAVTISSAGSLLLLVVTVVAAGRQPALDRLGAAAARRVATAVAGLALRHGGYLACALVAAAAGVALVLVPFKVAVAFVVMAGAATATFVVARAAQPLRPRAAQPLRLALPRSAVGDAAGDTADERPADRRFRLPRILYYLGLALIAQLTFRPVLGLTLSDLFFLASLLTTCFVLVLTAERVTGWLPTSVVVGSFLIALGGVTASFAAEDAMGSLAVTVRVVYLTAVWFWLGTLLLTTVRHVLVGVTVWATSAAVSGGAALVQIIFGDVVPGARNEAGRVTGFTDHINDLGGIAAVAFVPALALAVGARGGRSRFGLAGATALIGAGLVLSGSVGGLLAAAAGVFVWLGFGGARSRRFWLAAALGVVVAAGLIRLQETAGAPTPLERVSIVTAERGTESATLWTRLESYRLAWAEIGDSPLIGVGMDAASNVLPGLAAQVHNMLLLFWISAGLAGLAGLLVVLIAVLRISLHNVAAAATREAATLAPALLASFVSFVVFSMGAPILYKRYGWVAAALVLALGACSPRAAPSASRVSALPYTQVAPRGAAGRWAT